MNREEASFILANIDRRVCDDELNDALEMAIKALEQQPCEDAISRQAVLDGLASIAKVKAKSDAQKSLMGRAMFFVEKLPSVTQKSVKWIKRTDRLPEDKTYVLTTIKVPNRVAHARSGWYECGFFHNDNGDTWRATDMEVKAWMPLPEPYEPQERSGEE